MLFTVCLLPACCASRGQLGPQYPEVAMALNNLAFLYDLQGKYEQAEPLYQRALHILEQVQGPEHPDVAWWLFRMAEFYRKQSKYEQALHILEQAQGPEHSDMAWSLVEEADRYQKQGKYEQAEPLYQRALHIWEQWIISHPDDAAVYLHRGYLYLHFKERERACEDFAKYAFLRPKEVNAAWMVGYAALGKRHPGVEIAERLETIALLDPESNEACVCRGVALGLRGKHRGGLTELEQALHLNTRNEDAWFWKGMICAYLGVNTVAAESIERALHAVLPGIC